MKTNFLILSVFAFLSSLALSSAAQAGGSSSVGPANPASLLCAKLGGKYASGFEPAGEHGLCQFGRAMIGEWTLWRHKNGIPQEAVQVFLLSQEMLGEYQPMIPNPASVHCGKVGGQVLIVADRNGGQFGLCNFSDGSSIEEWTLFIGAADKANKQLVRALLK